MFVSIGQAAAIIGISISSLRRWEREGRFQPTFRTPGLHRRYRLADIQTHFLGESEKVKKRKVIAYARVSSHDQKKDLKRQIFRLKKFCHKSKFNYKVISDLGSGINYNKRGLNQLIQQVCEGHVSHLVLTHKDRLLRFGSPLLFKLCEYYNTRVVILDDPKKQSFEEELAQDVIEIMTVFSSKVYGRRSHANRKKLKKAA